MLRPSVRLRRNHLRGAGAELMPEEPRSVWDDQYDGWEDAYRHPPSRIRRLTRKAAGDVVAGDGEG